MTCVVYLLSVMDKFWRHVSFDLSHNSGQSFLPRYWPSCPQWVHGRSLIGQTVSRCLLFLTIVLFLLRYTYKALLAEMCRIVDFNWKGHFEAKFWVKGLRVALKSMDR